MVIAAILLVFLGFALFSKGSGDTIDKIWLADRINGSIADWIGIILFAAGAAWIGGLAEAFGFYGKKGDVMRNILVGAGLLVIGFLFFWS